MPNTDKKGDIEFTWSETWLLLAIALVVSKKNPANLTDIIIAGDAIEHAIFTLSELQIGLGKLLAAGYILDNNGGFALSSKFIDYFSQIPKEKRRFDTLKKAIANFLNAAPYPTISTADPEQT